jgi:hypothetical protein
LLYGFKQTEKGDFKTLEKKVLEWGEPTVASGKQVKWDNSLSVFSIAYSSNNNANIYAHMMITDYVYQSCCAILVHELAEIFVQSALWMVPCP